MIPNRLDHVELVIIALLDKTHQDSNLSKSNRAYFRRILDFKLLVNFVHIFFKLVEKELILLSLVLLGGNLFSFGFLFCYSFNLSLLLLKIASFTILEKLILHFTLTLYFFSSFRNRRTKKALWSSFFHGIWLRRILTWSNDWATRLISHLPWLRCI